VEVQIVQVKLVCLVFYGQKAHKESWCSSYQELDHIHAGCPFRSRKYAWSAGYRQKEVLGKEDAFPKCVSIITVGTVGMARTASSSMLI